MSTDSKTYQSGNDYILSSVVITNEYGEAVNVRNNVHSINIFENLERPYLTGDILLKDDFGFYDKFKINGTERVQITVTNPGLDFSVTKTFILCEIPSYTKTGDYAEIIHLKLIEKVGFDNQLTKFSRSYQGNPGSIIQKIIDDNLDGAVVNIGEIPAVQSNRTKFVVPYSTAFDACEMVKNRASTQYGMPFFFYRTLIDDDFQFKSIEEMMLKAPWNNQVPYRYSESFTNSDINHHSQINAFIVQSFSAMHKENALRLVEAAAVGSNYQIIDVTSGRRETFQYNVGAVFNDLYEGNILTKEQYPVMTTDYHRGDLQFIGSLPSKVVSRVVMNNTHGPEFKNYVQEDEISAYRLDAVRHSLGAMLKKNSINISVPGSMFLYKENRSIGSQIDFFYHSTDTQVLNGSGQAGEEEVKDKKRSGKYVVYAARHAFSLTSHDVELSAVKLGNLL